jgi:hypothetical protein
MALSIVPSTSTAVEVSLLITQVPETRQDDYPKRYGRGCRDGVWRPGEVHVVYNEPLLRDNTVLLLHLPFLFTSVWSPLGAMSKHPGDDAVERAVTENRFETTSFFQEPKKRLDCRKKSAPAFAKAKIVPSSWWEGAAHVWKVSPAPSPGPCACLYKARPGHRQNF